MPRLTNIQSANLIRKREVRNDKYYTPESLVRIHLSKLEEREKSLLIFEPFRGKGAYFNLFPEYFPNSFYQWREIDENQDFFDYRGEPDIIVSNPPFSILDRVFERCYELNPKIISFVLLQHAVTPCRIRRANEAGYFVTDYHLTRVDRWFGCAVILTLSREVERNLISFDCTKHKLEVEVREVEHALEV
jgi:hypothetical protein